jgi:hypothetical protein
MLTFNDKLYEFKCMKEKDINNSINSEIDENNNVINCNNNLFDFKAFIKLNDLDKTKENVFYFSIYIFSIY